MQVHKIYNNGLVIFRHFNMEMLHIISLIHQLGPTGDILNIENTNTEKLKSEITINQRANYFVTWNILCITVVWVSWSRKQKIHFISKFAGTRWGWGSLLPSFSVLLLLCGTSGKQSGPFVNVCYCFPTPDIYTWPPTWTWWSCMVVVGGTDEQYSQRLMMHWKGTQLFRKRKESGPLLLVGLPDSIFT